MNVAFDLNDDLTTVHTKVRRLTTDMSKVAYETLPLETRRSIESQLGLLRRREAELVARAEAERVAKVNKALGFPEYSMPQPFLGDTATSLSVWSQHELNTVYERVGGTVTTRIVERTCSTGSTWTATEITLTIEVSGIGPVMVSTDWDEESGGRNLPLMQAIPDAELIP
ncbi:hypothetical protein [Streptomyces sp. SAJ15]|uniref:hypothetical protein n=1 Tax=Streptomyces sp. SAJ15 TaxID=2011095 RepID=UPI0011865823|nr:hypothetical protein [Streptomyces sp. SAJ15]TVL89724.1 hypothetical protein CD790_25320 [Streptomyces sp. SAJ15]